MNTTGQLHLQTVEGTGLRFGARFASGRTTTFDSGTDAEAANPVESLLGATAACVAMDVISILRKKRHVVTAYEVEMEGERAETHPKRYLAMRFTHRVTGRAIPAATVAEIVDIAEKKYCSVRHTLDPALRVESRVEVIEG